MGKVIRAGLVALAVIALGAGPAPAGARQEQPSVRITSPRDGATVRGPEVEFRVQLNDFKAVEAGTDVRRGEGHAHLVIDRPAPGPGETVPTADGYVHLGREPFDSRSVPLSPGQHTITAVLGDSTHKVLDRQQTHQVTITVLGEAGQPPTRPADTGDGSLADDGIGLTGAIALLIGAGSLGLVAFRRRA